MDHDVARHVDLGAASLLERLFKRADVVGEPKRLHGFAETGLLEERANDAALDALRRECHDGIAVGGVGDLQRDGHRRLDPLEAVELLLPWMEHEHA